MVSVVVSQSMYFPWVGLLEQVSSADLFVHYDDVQYVRGFCNRVQLKTPGGQKWMTVPLRGWHRGQRIDEVQVDESADWRSKHIEIMCQAYRKAPYVDDMIRLAEEVFSKPAANIADISRETILALVNYFDIGKGVKFTNSSSLDISGRSTQRLHDIVSTLGGDIYITGHGAKNYLDHDIFERSGIEVRYMQYSLLPYPQLHGEFTPFVSALDLVANCGRAGRHYIHSKTVNWKEFVHGSW